ncbi:MAG: Ig-like domain-containing protein, partial [Nitrospira sp.]|nr:Ig-like domain-containing protein [Nitrospira sp.]
MTPLAGVVSGLDRTDSLLNIQANGTIYKSSRVTITPLNSVLSPQSSALLVDIDLTGIMVGAGARLSFDLLGFGDRTSTVTIDNVLLTDGTPTAAPIAVNDSYSLAEGGYLDLMTFDLTTFGLLSNDLDIDTTQSSLSALLVSPPVHGALTLNSDGSFRYIHNGSETLTDAFTYQVSDGINFSNLATVSLTITPTNDAPVIAPIPTQSVEQARTLQFAVVATDPDDSNLSPESSVLTYSLGAGAPAEATIDSSTGFFTWSVPRTQPIGFYAITVHVTDAGTPALTASQTFTVEVLELTNTPPVLNPIGNQTVNEGELLTFTVSASDVDGPTQLLSFSASGLPDGATFDMTTGLFTWTPTDGADESPYSMTIEVSDGVDRASETIVLTAVNVDPDVSLTPSTQTVQYSDPIVPIVITATDVTADTLNVTTAWSTNGTTFTSGLPDALTLTGGLALTGAVNQVGTASWTISGIADLDPAQVYTIRVTVTDEDGGTTVQQAIIDPTPEDVQATYNGPLLLSTADINTSTATVSLRATIQDITAVAPGTDPNAGVVTQATVTFLNRDTGAIIAANVPVTLLDPANPTTGVAGYDWMVNLGNQDSESYTIGVRVNGFYGRNSALDNTVVTVSKPLQNFITGGGYFVNQRSAGLYAGDPGEKTNFGFNVKFNKQLTNIQGKANLIIRQQGHVYQIRTNSTDSLVVQSLDPLTQQAVFTAKANLKDITDPLNPITLGGNLDLVATVTDRGEPGTSDTVAFTLWKQNQLWYASAWNGSKTIEQVLAGGNIQAHTNPQALTLDEAPHALQTSIPEPLILEETSLLVEAARTQWIQSGLGPEADRLVSVEVRVADLPGSTLAWTLGSTIWLDADAAGQGWFVDQTPFLNEEWRPRETLNVKGETSGWSGAIRDTSDGGWQLVAVPGSAAYGRVDLLTTVLHEMGHVLGYDDQAATNSIHATLMTETLSAGLRRLPSGLESSLSGWSGSFGLSDVSGLSGSFGFSGLSGAGDVSAPDKPE